jgi:hypothetical protein
MSYHTFKFLTWWGHPAGIKTASPSFCSKVQGSTPAYGMEKKEVNHRGKNHLPKDIIIPN